MNNKTVRSGIIDAAAVVLVIAHATCTGHKSSSVSMVIARDNATHIGCRIGKSKIFNGGDTIFDAANVKFLTFRKITEWC